MSKTNLGGFARTVLAVAALMSAQFASAEVVAGEYVKMSDSPVGNLGGGAFLTTEVKANGTALSGEKSFYTFCLEKYETFTVGQTLKVAGVNNYTTNKTSTYYTTDANRVSLYDDHTKNQDPLSKATEWLFTKFNVDSSFNAKVMKDNASANSFQRAIWYLEGELFSTTKDRYNKTDMDYFNGDANAKLWTNDAIANAANWVDQGNQVRAVNLMKTDKYGNYTQHAQDQLYFVSAIPEPETYAMMLAGLGLMGTIVRRRKNKNV